MQKKFQNVSVQLHARTMIFNNVMRVVNKPDIFEFLFLSRVHIYMVSKHGYFSVPLTKVTLMPSVNDASLTVISRENTNLTCETDSSRPAASFQWYINGQNGTDQAIDSAKENGTQYISFSTLSYFGRIEDHNRIISCEAFNTYITDRNFTDQKSLNVLSKYVIICNI